MVGTMMALPGANGMTMISAASASSPPPPPQSTTVLLLPPCCCYSLPSSHPPTSPSPASSVMSGRRRTRRREWMLLLTAALLSPVVSPKPSSAEEEDDDEQRLVRLFQETTASVVCIKDLHLVGDNKGKGKGVAQENVAVDGIGSGFVWDKMGHIVTNYHVIAKFATSKSGQQRCEVFLLDTYGNTFSKEAKLVGVDPACDLAVLKVDVEGDQLRPAVLGTSYDLRVGQSCLAIGNPYGYEHTLTTGVVSGLGREIPSQNGQSIRGAIQTDAAINAGNSGGPLIDSHGHVIGVNTATFSRKGTGSSSGVNFAIPVDLVVRIVPYLIVYGTSTSNRF